jgi:hypothetical protein
MKYARSPCITCASSYIFNSILKCDLQAMSCIDPLLTFAELLQATVYGSQRSPNLAPRTHTKGPMQSNVVVDSSP